MIASKCTSKYINSNECTYMFSCRSKLYVFIYRSEIYLVKLWKMYACTKSVYIYHLSKVKRKSLFLINDHKF